MNAEWNYVHNTRHGLFGANETSEMLTLYEITYFERMLWLLSAK